MASTKTVGGVTYDRGDFLVVEDPEQVSTWHLPVKVHGVPDRRLAGAAWAALFSPGGYRGNRYEGPDKEAARRKLRALYRSEEWEMSDEQSEAEHGTALAGDFIPLVEKAVRRDGTIAVKMIQPGWGSSGYYSREVLERDVPKVFPKGTHMYWNHPTLSEQSERPERDLRDLAAVTVSEPRFQEDGPAGPGVYADAKVFAGYGDAINEIAEHIGVSIFGKGVAKNGVAEGREGRIVEKITDGSSVDFVTRPGAGGAVVSVFESAPGAARLSEPEQTPQAEMSESAQDNETALENIVEARNMDEVQELRESLATAQQTIQEQAGQLARLQEQLVLRDARDFVATRLAETELPDVTRQRLVRQLAANPPVADGALNEAMLAESVTAAVEAAEAEVAAIAGMTGQIRGQGGQPAQATPTLEEAERRTREALAQMGYGGTNG